MDERGKTAGLQNSENKTMDISLKAAVAAPLFVIASAAYSLDAPENLVCGISPTSDPTTYPISWDEVDGATKYALELACQSQPPEAGAPSEYSVTVKAPKGSIECDGESCTAEIAESVIADAILAAATTTTIDPTSGEEVEEVNENMTNANWACEAKVKGLNPPGGRQDYDQAVTAVANAPCISINHGCPAWSEEEIADVGSHGFPDSYDDLETVSPNGDYTLMDDEEDGNTAVFALLRIIGGERQAFFRHDPVDPSGGLPYIFRQTLGITAEQFNACADSIRQHSVNDCPPGAFGPTYRWGGWKDNGVCVSN
jgi:hypothetical protein